MGILESAIFGALFGTLFFNVMVTKVVGYSRRKLLIWAAVFLCITYLFCVWLIIYRTDYTATPLGYYTDHLSREYDSWAFIHEGFRIFDTPRMYFFEKYPPGGGHESWGKTPVPMPPGFLLIFIPFGILSYGALLPHIVVHRLMIMLLTFIALLYAFVFFRMNLLQRILSKEGRVGLLGPPLLFFAFYYLFLLVYFSLNGCYEAVPLFFILLSVKEFLGKKWFTSLSFYVLAFFIKYQTLFLLPLGLIAFKNAAQSREFQKHKFTSIILVILLLTNFYTMYLTFLKFNSEYIDLHSFFLNEPILSIKSLFFLLFSIGVIGLLIAVNEVIIGFTVFTILFFIFFLSYYMMWYDIWFISLIPLSKKRYTIPLLFTWMLVHDFLLSAVI